MTILLYNYCELQERASRNLKVWKAFHLILYTIAGVFGILNYIFLRNAMELVDNNCILYPRELAFRTFDTHKNESTAAKGARGNESAINSEALINDSTLYGSETQEVLTDDDNPRLILDISRTLFEHDSDCQFPEYMPILSTIFAAVWITLFTMCPGGGYSRSGLHQPWRILTPALLFALVLVGLTGHSFTWTNGGLHAFCSAFYNVTNSTDCSAASPYLQRSWNSSWGLSGRVDITRAASAATWATWACVAALFLARCFAAPDFQVRATKAYLKDPQQKLTPYLKKQRRSHQSPVSPSKRDTISVRSEPTVTTELVTVSIEQDQDTAPPSLQATPVKRDHKPEVMELKGVPDYN